MVSFALATPTSSQIQDAQKQASEARKKLSTLGAQLEMASEDLAEAQAEAEKTRGKITALNARLKREEARLQSAQNQLNERANALYRQGSISMIDILFSSSNFSDLVSRLDLMQKISKQDSELLIEVRGAKAAIELSKAELEKTHAKQVRAQKTAEQKKRETEAIFAEQQRYLSSLSDQIKDLMEQQEREQEAKRAAQARAQAAAQEAAQKQAARQSQAQTQADSASRSTSSGSAESAEGGTEAGSSSESASSSDSSSEESSQSSNSTGIIGERTFRASALGAGHTSVVAIAKKFVGITPYVWGGTSPKGFDCSGLVQYCYRKVGISLSRTSRQQYYNGAYIPPNRKDLLKPGDLLFFASSRNVSTIHHVAIYAGNGLMIHAPYTGVKVSITSLASRSDYIGATRP